MECGLPLSPALHHRKNSSGYSQQKIGPSDLLIAHAPRLLIRAVAVTHTHSLLAKLKTDYHAGILRGRN